LLDLLRLDHPEMLGVGVDFPVHTLAPTRERVTRDHCIEHMEHDGAETQPALRRVDAAVSPFAIHHREDERKRSLYRKVFDLLDL
jgi:hypothetical protein